MNDNSKRYTMLKLFITLIMFVILCVSIFHIDTIKAASKDDAADSSIISSDIISDEPVTNNPVLLGDTKLTNSDIYEIPADITSEWGNNLKCVIEYVDVCRKEGEQVVKYSIPSMTVSVYSTEEGKSKLSNAQAMRKYIQELNSNINTHPDARKWLESHKPLKDGKDMGKESKVYRIGFPKYSHGNNQIYLTDKDGSTFKGCEDLYGINLSNLNTSECKNMSHMFEGCHNLREIIYGHENVLNDQGVEDVQANCYFDTSKVTDMNSMYKDCYSLKVANLPKTFYTSNVEDMSSMFENCVNLCDISFGSDINPVDESGCFDTSKVINMSKMFKNCRHVGRPKELISPENQISGDLQTLIMPKNFTVENCKDLSEMFYCDNKTAIEYDNHGNHVGQAELEHTSWLKEIVTWDGKAFVFDAPNATTTKDMFCGLESLGGYSVGDSAGKLPVVKTSDSLTDCSGMFKGCANMGLPVGDKSDDIDVSHMKTENVNDFSSMFEGCKNIKRVKGFNNINSTNATTFDSMFKNCIDLKTFSDEYGPGLNFFTNNVESMSSMFEGCFALENAKTIYFSGDSLSNMNKMFKGCGNLLTIDLQSMKNSNVNLFLWNLHLRVVLTCRIFTCKILMQK